MLKNILRSLSRFRLSTAMNLLGLSFAFAAFIIISMQVVYYLGFDRSYKDHQRVYMLNITDSLKENQMISFNRQIPIFIKERVPQIEQMTVTNVYPGNVLMFAPDKEVVGKSVTDFVSVNSCENDYVTIFGLEFISGDIGALGRPDNVIISQSVAAKFFPDGDPLAREIELGGHSFIVGAVYKDFPQNSSRPNGVYCHVGDRNINDPSNYSYSVFVKLAPGVSKQQADQMISQAMYQYNEGESTLAISELINIVDYPYEIMGLSRNFIWVLITIAILILVIAAINFVNFATSLVPLKIRSVNLRKVVGATVWQIRGEMIMEAVLLSFVAFVLAFGIVELFKASALREIISADMGLGANLWLYVATLGVALVLGGVSSIYPAVYATSFQPAMVLGGNFALGAGGRRLRMVLIGFQFFVSMCLLIAMFFVRSQYDHMLTRDGGYSKQGVVHVAQKEGWGKNDLIKEKLLSCPDIKDMAFCNAPFGVIDGHMGWGREYSGGPFSIQCMPVSHNFLDFFGIKILKGRNFMPSDDFSENGYFIMNQKAQDTYNFLDGELISGHREPTSIVGICSNVNFYNMKQEINEMAFYIFGKEPWNELSNAYIKIDGNVSQALEHIQKSYAELEPDYPIAVNFMDDELKVAYKEEGNLKTMMSLFSALAVIIALVGVFGMVSFDTRYRRKEISLRKINGATVGDILSMFSLSYLKIVGVAFVIAAPVAYYGVSRWLEGMPYRISITPWYFILSLVMVALLTLVVSVVQSYRCATENPIKAIKTN